MKVLILDIGCSNTKCFAYQGDADRVSLIEWKQFRTQLNSIEEIVKDCEHIIDAFVEIDRPDCILTTSFSDSVVVVNHRGELTLHAPLDSCVSERALPPYLETGYPTVFPGLLPRLHDLKNERSQQFKNMDRALPVSAFISGMLCFNIDWKKWDWTHASNTGAWQQAHQEWIPSEFSDLIPWETVSPAKIIGEREDIPVMLGGHDQMFITARTIRAYVNTGTYTTVSVPQDIFSPRDDEKDSVRWLRDPSQTLHKQVCFKTPEVLTGGVYDHVARFLEKSTLETKEIAVVGSFAHMMATELRNRGFTPRVREFMQHEEAAKFALRHLS
jgi:sugar (pentulose or hexulose) kinase